MDLAAVLAPQLRALEDAEATCQGLLMSIRRAKESLLMALHTHSLDKEPTTTTEASKQQSGMPNKHVAFAPSSSPLRQSPSRQDATSPFASSRPKPRAMGHSPPDASSSGYIPARDSLGMSPQHSIPRVYLATSSRRVTQPAQPARQPTHSSLTVDMLTSNPSVSASEDERIGDSSTYGDAVDSAETRSGSDSFVRRLRPAPIPTPASPSSSEGARSPILRASAAAVDAAGEHLARLDAAVREAMYTAARLGEQRVLSPSPTDHTASWRTYNTAHTQEDDRSAFGTGDEGDNSDLDAGAMARLQATSVHDEARNDAELAVQRLVETLSRLKSY